MSLRFRASNIAIFLCTIAAFAAAQAGGIGPVVVSADNTISASTTVSSGSTTLRTSTESENNVSTSTSAKFVLGVGPVSNSVSAGGFAKFNIRIEQGPNADTSAVIYLVARGVPPRSVAIFTPDAGVADPEFNSTLTIVTSPNTPADNYEVTVVARVNGQEFSTQVALEITATTGATAIMTVSTAANLFMTVTTDQTQYQPNATVTVQGQVTDATGSAITNAAVSVQVDSPTGTQVLFENNIQTDSAGTFQAQVVLPASATLGTYTVFATASQVGYLSTAARATFVAGASTTPSVSISAVYAGDSSGNPVPTVAAGQTVWIWVVVHNNGATFQGVVWVQVHDPNGVPVQIGIHIETLTSGETIKDGLGFTLPDNAAHGVYRVDALVSDKMISQGGTFLAEAQTQFALMD